jgi:hypothetical protein
MAVPDISNRNDVVKGKSTSMNSIRCRISKICVELVFAWIDTACSIDTANEPSKMDMRDIFILIEELLAQTVLSEIEFPTDD